METLTTINTNIKEDHQREETVASSSINVLLNAKSVVRKDTMPRIATADTSNLVITHFWVTPKFFFFSSKKKNLHGAVLNGTVQLLLPCACKVREEEDFLKMFFPLTFSPFHFIKPCQNPYPHNHTLPT